MADQPHKIIDETRRSIVDAIIAYGDLTGDKEYHDFLKWVYPSASDSDINEVWRHMDRFDDWPEAYFIDTILDYLSLSDQEFFFFLEQYVNPNLHHTRWDEEEERRVQIPNSELVDLINKYLIHDGFELKIKDSIGDKNFFQCVSLNPGVQGKVKNIIFAAKYKPEIVFDDALNNDIRITKNADQCLIYDRPIPAGGLKWNELVDWYAEENNITEDKERAYCRRLAEPLDSDVEKILMNGYYLIAKETNGELPALIPQVYLYYDPQTIKQRGYKLFEHQKMDYLMILSHRDCIVIEVDGKQHYAEGYVASPRLYADMMKAHREMSLYGYDVYCFGGDELYEAVNDVIKRQETFKMLRDFFSRLFHKYGIEVGS